MAIKSLPQAQFLEPALPAVERLALGIRWEIVYLPRHMRRLSRQQRRIGRGADYLWWGPLSPFSAAKSTPDPAHRTASRSSAVASLSRRYLQSRYVVVKYHIVFRAGPEVIPRDCGKSSLTRANPADSARVKLPCWRKCDFRLTPQWIYGEARGCHTHEFPRFTGLRGPPLAGFVVSGGSAPERLSMRASVAQTGRRSSTSC